MSEVLDIIDKAIKRLLPPVAMLVAAALLSKGLHTPDSNELVIKSLMALLVIYAFLYMLASTCEAIRSMVKANFSNLYAALICSSFILVYFVLFVAAIRLGFEKVAQ